LNLNHNKFPWGDIGEFDNFWKVKEAAYPDQAEHVVTKISLTIGFRECEVRVLRQKKSRSVFELFHRGYAGRLVHRNHDGFRGLEVQLHVASGAIELGLLVESECLRSPAWLLVPNRALGNHRLSTGPLVVVLNLSIA